jgi:UDP-glucose 4-epimerase
MKPEKILVTGAAGFIGSNLCERLLSLGHAVCAVDNLSQSTLRNLKEFLDHPDFEFFQEDVRNVSAIESLARDATILVHLAAFKIPRYGDAYDTLTINVHGTESVLKAAVKNKAKVVLASTSDVYGKNPHLPFAETHDLYMGESNVKRWAYAVSKILDEHYCLAYQQEHGIPVTILRFFGGYGPRQNTTWWGGPQSVFIRSNRPTYGNPWRRLADAELYLH